MKRVGITMDSWETPALQGTWMSIQVDLKLLITGKWKNGAEKMVGTSIRFEFKNVNNMPKSCQNPLIYQVQIEYQDVSNQTVLSTTSVKKKLELNKKTWNHTGNEIKGFFGDH